MASFIECDYCGQPIKCGDVTHIYERGRGTVRAFAAYKDSSGGLGDTFHFHTDLEGEGTDCMSEALARLRGMREWAQRNEEGSNLEWRLVERDPARLPLGRERSSVTPPPPLTQSHGLYWLEALQDAPRHALYRSGIRTIGELVKLSREDLLALPGVGAKSVVAIEQSLAEYGVALAAGAVA